MDDKKPRTRTELDMAELILDEQLHAQRTQQDVDAAADGQWLDASYEIEAESGHPDPSIEESEG